MKKITLRVDDEDYKIIKEIQKNFRYKTLAPYIRRTIKNDLFETLETSRDLNKNYVKLINSLFKINYGALIRYYDYAYDQRFKKYRDVKTDKLLVEFLLNHSWAISIDYINSKNLIEFYSDCMDVNFLNDNIINLREKYIYELETYNRYMVSNEYYCPDSNDIDNLLEDIPLKLKQELEADIEYNDLPF